MDALNLIRLPFDLATLPPGWFSKNQINCLYQLVQQTEGPILEVGPWIGRSTCVIGEALRPKSNPPLFHTVDYGIASEAEWEHLFGTPLSDKPNAEDYRPHVTRPGGSVVSLLENLGIRGLMDYVKVHRCDLHDIQFPYKFSLIFCDATHSKAEIDKNIPALLDMLQPGGIIACDDISDRLYEHILAKFKWKWSHVESLLFYGEPDIS